MDGPDLLAAYLSKKNLSPAELARSSRGRLTESDLSRYLARKATPGREKSLAIGDLTKTREKPRGEVPPESWGNSKTRKRRAHHRKAA